MEPDSPTGTGEEKNNPAKPVGRGHDEGKELEWRDPQNSLSLIPGTAPQLHRFLHAFVAGKADTSSLRKVSDRQGCGTPANQILGNGRLRIYSMQVLA
jgi:hypothetical protein